MKQGAGWSDEALTSSALRGNSWPRDCDQERMAYGDRVRVTKVVPTLQCGGREKQILALTGRLDARRFDVERVRAGGSITQQLRFAAHLFRRRVHIVHGYSFYG